MIVAQGFGASGSTHSCDGAIRRHAEIHERESGHETGSVSAKMAGHKNAMTARDASGDGEACIDGLKELA
jgi:hypothetical protein